jgi:hypothetical protein
LKDALGILQNSNLLTLELVEDGADPSRASGSVHAWLLRNRCRSTWALDLAGGCRAAGNAVAR